MKRLNYEIRTDRFGTFYEAYFGKPHRRDSVYVGRVVKIESGYRAAPIATASPRAYGFKSLRAAIAWLRSDLQATYGNDPTVETLKRDTKTLDLENAKARLKEFKNRQRTNQ